MKAEKPLIVMVLILALLAVALILPAATVAEVRHTDHHAASGEWGVYDVVFETEKEVGGYDLFSGTKYANWTGTFRRSSVEPPDGFVFLPAGRRLPPLHHVPLQAQRLQGKRQKAGNRRSGHRDDCDLGSRWAARRHVDRRKRLGGLKRLQARGPVGQRTRGSLYSGEVWLK